MGISRANILFIGLCVMLVAATAQAQNVSPSIHDAGGSVGIATTNPDLSYRLDIHNGQLVNSRDDGLAGGIGARQWATWTEARTIFNFFADGANDAGSLRNLAQFYVVQDGPESARLTFSTNAGGGIVDKLTILGSGRIGVGTSNPVATLHVAGDAQVDGNIAAKYQDVAEWVEAAEPLVPGTVVAIDTGGINRVVASSAPYDVKVAGVVSDRPGVLLGERTASKVKVAHSGRVRVKVDAGYGPVSVGDLLVTSATPGHAMRSSTPDGGNSVRPGTLLGKALEPLEQGRGEILVLLTLQ